VRRRIRENVDVAVKVAVDVAVKVDRSVKKEVKQLRRIIADGGRVSGAHSGSAFKY